MNIAKDSLYSSIATLDVKQKNNWVFMEYKIKIKSFKHYFLFFIRFHTANFITFYSFLLKYYYVSFGNGDLIYPVNNFVSDLIMHYWHFLIISVMIYNNAQNLAVLLV